MARCTSCASEIAGNSRFCPACGVAVESEAFATQTVAVSTPRATPPSSERRTSGLHSSSGTSQGRFAPGYLLGGRYRIVALLGKGGRRSRRSGCPKNRAKFSTRFAALHLSRRRRKDERSSHVARPRNRSASPRRQPDMRGFLLFAGRT